MGVRFPKELKTGSLQFPLKNRLSTKLVAILDAASDFVVLGRCKQRPWSLDIWHRPKGENRTAQMLIAIVEM